MPELGEPISERELDVLNCLAEGASNREIADRLSISHHTVKVHVRNIFTKLGVSSRTEATTVALQKGMLSIPGIATEPQTAEAAPEGEAIEDDPAQPAVLDGDAVAGGQEEITEELSSEEALLSEQPEDTLPAAQPAGRSRISRRQLMAIVGILAVLVVALAVNSLLRGDERAQATTEAESGATSVAFEETAIGENWVSSRAMPEARQKMALATVGLNIYAIGGEGDDGVDNRVFIFNSQQQEWQEGAPKLTAVAGAAAAVVEGEIYVAGGYGANGAATTAVEAYSPLNNAWRPVTALPRPLAGAVAIAGDGQLYLFGGEDGGEALDSSFVYDPGAQQWQELPPLPTARAFAVGGLLGGALYVVGGSDGAQPLDTCELFDPASAAWSACPALSQPRAAAGSAVVLNKLYVVGGRVGEEGSYGELFDVAEAQWAAFTIPMLEESADWPYLGVANVETHIYAVGGERGGQMSDALYVYRPLVYTFFIPAASAGGGE